MLRPLICCCLAIAVVAGESDPPLLASSGLAAGAAETVLPGGAVLHVRLARPAATLDALDALVTSFAPRAALPDDLKPFRDQPKPLLAWLGAQTLGQPLTPQAISSATGIALDRPLTLTFYADDPATAWALALPYSDAAALTNLVSGAFGARTFERIAIGGHAAWHVVGTSPSLPRQCWILCSDDTAFLCGSPSIAKLLVTANMPRLAADPLVAEQSAVAEDLTLALTPAAIKPLVAGFAPRLSTIPPEMLVAARAQLIADIPPAELAQIDRTLRWNLGIPGHEFVLDVVECAATAGAEVVVPALAQLIQGFDGVALGIALSGERQRVRVALRSAAIAPTDFAAALPLADIRKAVAALPGTRDWLDAAGRAPIAGANVVFAAWADRFAQKLAAKHVADAAAVALARFAHDAKPLAGVDSAVPWTMGAMYAPERAAAPAATLAEHLARLRTLGFDAPFALFPAQADGFVADVLARRAAVANANAALLDAVLAGFGGDEPWLTGEARFRTVARPGKATRLVYEDVMTTASGLFGYSQHELVNRLAWDTAALGPYQVLQPVQGARGTWLDAAAPAPTPVPAALTALLDQVPEGADELTVLRLLPFAPRVAAELVALEATMRREFDAYLAACAPIVDEASGDPAAVDRLQRVPMPMLVASLNVGDDRVPYLVLAGGLRYPRPAAMPLLQKLIEEAARASDAVGGAVAWTTVAPGRLDSVVVQDTRGAARFVATAADAAWRDWLATPAAQQALQAALSAPGDGDAAPAQALVRNAMWDETPRRRPRAANGARRAPR